MDDTLKDSWAAEGPISKTIKDRIKKAGKSDIHFRLYRCLPL